MDAPATRAQQEPADSPALTTPDPDNHVPELSAPRTPPREFHIL